MMDAGCLTRKAVLKDGVVGDLDGSLPLAPFWPITAI